MLSGNGGVSSAQSTADVSVDMSEAETLLLYLVNRTRRYPQQWASRLSISLPSDQVGPFAPLVANASLLQASRLHSQEMLSRTTLSHSGANGSSPGDRALLAGYPTQFVGENVGFDWNFPSYTADAIAHRMNDGWFTSSGHRANMLTPSWTQFGGAFAVRQPPNGTQYATEKFGRHDVGPFLTGVVFSDRNADADFDAGEGIGGVTVTATSSAGTFTATTQAAGGWALKVPAGQYTVSASGGSFGGRGSASITVGTASVAVDFISSRTNGWVNFEEQTSPGTPGDPATMPLAPSRVVATAGAGRATVSWAPPTSNGGAAITNYIVQHSRDGGSTWVPFSGGAASSATTTTVTGLTGGVRYTFRVAAVNAAGTGAFSSASNAVTPTGTVAPPPTPPRPTPVQPSTIHASVTGPAATVTEGANATFTITLSEAPTKPVQVGYRTVSGSATAGRDFAAIPGFVTFSPGETSKTVTVSTIDDTVREAAEWFTLQLVRRPGPAYIRTGVARAMIADNDAGGPQPSAANLSIAAATFASLPSTTSSVRKATVIR